MNGQLPVVLHTRVVNGSGGGPDKTILNSPRFLADSGYRVLCAYMHPPGDRGFDELRRKAARWQAPLVSIPDRGALDPGVVRQLFEVCRRERVAIWHGHDYKSNAIGLVLRAFWPMQLVTTVHGWVKHTARTPVYYGIDRLCLPYYERVICVSQDLLERCRAGGVSAERCVLVENAIDTAQYSRTLQTGEAKRRLGFDPRRLLIGAVGRLSEEKGFDGLIRAVDELLKKGRDVELIIAGDGDQQARLEALIRELGRRDRIQLLGYRSDVAELLEAMDVFALSSLREGLPNVVLEALAMQVPVVATSVAGVPNVIEHGVTGLLVSPGSVVELAEALEVLALDAAQRSRLGAAGRRLVETRFSFARRMEKIRAIYDSLLRHGRPHGSETVHGGRLPAVSESGVLSECR